MTDSPGRFLILAICRPARFDAIADALGGDDLRLEHVADLDEALGRLGERHFHVIVADELEDTGMRSLLSIAKAPLIIVRKELKPAQAAAAVRAGVFEVVGSSEGLTASVRAALEARNADLLRPRWSESERNVLNRIVCRTQEMQLVVERVRMLAKTPSTTGLILGETGSGKELVASAVHALSERAQKPFIAVDCSAIPESLFESELFGHERGAFSGASSERKGRFELADGGTLFLDEIGELPIAMQPKVLRALEERQVWRVGASAPRPVNIRVLAATHRQLESWVKQGKFRADLFYRLSVFLIDVPPLRARTNDILHLADFFVRRFCTEQQRALVRLSPRASAALVAHAFPGNVRELRNIIEQAIATTSGEVIEARDLVIRGGAEVGHGTRPAATVGAEEHLLPLVFGEHALDQLERQAIELALRLAHDNRSVAARMLGISRVRITRTIRRYGLQSVSKIGRPPVEITAEDK